MTLRRITDAFRKQDWFTVGVETLIVVFGVFIGLQVNNWNTAREGREQERNYLARLHEEVAAILVEQESDRAYTVETANRLMEVTAYFDAFGKQEATTLEPEGDHCTAVIASHIYAGDITLPPTISELIATGRILLISNESLRLQIVQLAQAHHPGPKARASLKHLIGPPDRPAQLDTTRAFRPTIVRYRY